MRKFLISVLLLLMVFSISVFATDFGEYVSIIQEEYKKRETYQDVIENWRNGVLLEYGYMLDHVTITFEFVRGAETTDEKILIVGVTTTTAFCYTKEKRKMRIIQMVGMAILFTKDKRIDKSSRMTDYQKTVVSGWDNTVDA